MLCSDKIHPLEPLFLPEIDTFTQEWHRVALIMHSIIKGGLI